MALPKCAGRSIQQSRRVFTYVAIAVLAVQSFSGLSPWDMVDTECMMTFAVPSTSVSANPAGLSSVTRSDANDYASASPAFGWHSEPQRHKSAAGRTSRRAAEISVVQKVVNAMGAGAVASVIQAALSAVGEPIVNRVLVKRMKIMEAINDVSPKMMLNFFKTTLTTNFLKFPFFEAINAFCAVLPLSPSVRGIATGFVFTTATLPVTNYRYRKSMELPVNWANIYEAYVPTVIRDMVYGIGRNWFTVGLMAMNPTWTTASPSLLFIVVIAGCLVSAPFNEWRGYLLQSKGQELTFSEFFKPSNFVRSTSLGAIKQGLALAVGYWCAPPATKFVNGLIAAIKGV